MTRKVVAPVRTTDADTETTGTEKARQGRRLPIVMTSTINIIQLKSDLSEHIKGEYEFRNTRNGTRIITKKW
jgi:hypothetical protein